MCRSGMPRARWSSRTDRTPPGRGPDRIRSRPPVAPLFPDYVLPGVRRPVDDRSTRGTSRRFISRFLVVVRWLIVRFRGVRPGCRRGLRSLVGSATDATVGDRRPSFS
ncbi:hypothetical protein Francci3_0946 [Frankia casuarinae]|uniref:Uncharacterized protein n=1 Tax=Frankia casuarinae (strain DSM 45818 / CECT 9043 / HFP020203 / CcI3) TaxID=106370 RepID=Q2JEG2_FRACC|nr:hypothetical protein Francci3_0946 [Frankia casuarinae]